MEPLAVARFLKWTADLAPLPPPLEVVLTEVDEKGRVMREVGFGRNGGLEYVKPSGERRWGRDGIFYLIDLPAPADEVDPAEFERVWALGEGAFE
jgi:hypothetical protein